MGATVWKVLRVVAAGYTAVWFAAFVWVTGSWARAVAGPSCTMARCGEAHNAILAIVALVPLAMALVCGMVVWMSHAHVKRATTG